MGSLQMLKAAFAEAERLGHSWVGPEHGLLAILRGDPADTARRAIRVALPAAPPPDVCEIAMRSEKSC